MNNRLLLMLESNEEFAYIRVDSAMVSFREPIEQAVAEIRKLEGEKNDLERELTNLRGRTR